MENGKKNKQIIMHVASDHETCARLASLAADMETILSFYRVKYVRS